MHNAEQIIAFVRAVDTLTSLYENEAYETDLVDKYMAEVVRLRELFQIEDIE